MPFELREQERIVEEEEGIVVEKIFIMMYLKKRAE